MVIFKGSNGVRAGWRFLAWLVILVGTWFVFSGGVWSPLAGKPIFPPHWFDINGPGQRMFGEIEILVPVAFAAFVMSRFERKSMFAYGFQRQSGAANRYAEGFAVGAVMMGIAAVLMIAFGGMRIHGFGLSGTEWLIYPLGWMAFMVAVGFSEEYLFRGYPLVALTRGLGFWVAAIIVSLLFGAAHVGKLGENAIDVVNIVALGFVMCIALWRTGSLWLAAGFHTAFDYMQFFVIGTRNGSLEPQGTLFNSTFPGPAWVNGGPLGTEASYFMFPLIVTLLFYVLWRFRGTQPGVPGL